MTPRKKRFITVYEKENEQAPMKKIYEGEDERTYNQDYQDKIFGFSKMEMLKLISYLVLAVVFLTKTDTRIAKIEETQGTLIQAMQKSLMFQENSDIWHSTVLGTSFKNGAPTNPNIDIKQLKRNWIDGVEK